MSLANRAHTFISAGFSGNWVLTNEPEEAQRELTLLSTHKGYEILVWDIVKGIQNPKKNLEPADPKTRNPLAPLMSTNKTTEGPQLILLWNFHLFLKEREVLQALYNAILAGQKNQVFYFILSCHEEMPTELEKLLVVHTHSLPNDAEIAEIANNLLENPEKSPVDIDIINSARGLTRREIEGAFALTIIKNNCIDPKTVIKYKSETIKKKGFLTFYEGDANFKNLVGLEELKWFTKKILTPKTSIVPKGLLLLGPPGTGKSQFAKALGGELNRPVLLCDLGKIYAKYVGETETNLREMINIAESMAPCILFLDELEKTLSGISSDGDGGVSKRVFGKLLTWLNDKTKDVFVVGTCNNIKILPPEFCRAGRFDGLFFIDLPNKTERESIWQHYIKQYNPTQESRHDIKDEGWTGAEIEECVKKSLQLEIPIATAARYVIPVNISRKEEIESLQEWGKGRCMSASYVGKYTGPQPSEDRNANSKRRALSNQTTNPTH